MSYSGFPMLFLFKRNGFLRGYKLSRNLVSGERYFCSKIDDGDQKQKNSLEKNPSAAESKEASTSSKLSSKDDASDKKAAAKKKLFALLSEFKVEQEKPSMVARNLNLAKAVKRISKKERFQDIPIKKELTPQEKMQLAVKNVAENVSGDPEQTKLELNEKLSSLNIAESPKSSSEVVDAEVDEEMKENIMSSVKEIANTVTDSAPTAAIKSKLTQRLLRLSLEDTSASHPKKSIDLLKGMKIEQRFDQRRKEQTEFDDKADTNQKRRMKRPRLQAMINIFQSPALDIFSVDKESKIDSKKTVWQSLEENNLKLLVQFAPTNGFEEMILWTEQGKHWKFPIDNEIDMGDEENVGFHEHVFLEQHLHGFPTKGPIQQFMELVVVGLSKNPYISVERKIENIDWFRNYFKEKEEILKQYGATIG